MKLRISVFSLLLALFIGGSAYLVQEPGSQAVQDMASIDECGYNEDIPEVEDYMRLITFGDPYMGNFDAGVTVVEYFDPNCPHCKTFHPIMKQVIADNEQHARFFMIPFVLWQYSLAQAEALFVAGQDGKYFEMLDAQYDNQKAGGMSLDELVLLAEDIGLDPEVFRGRLERGLNQRMIIARRQEISDLGIGGTPTVMINGRFISSDSKSRECMNQLIAGVAIQSSGG